MCPYMLKKIECLWSKRLNEELRMTKKNKTEKRLPKREPNLFKVKEQEQELAEKKKKAD